MTETFNLKDLSVALADQFNLRVQLSADMTRFMLDTVMDALVEGKQVRLHQFGTLEARQRPARNSRNPRTGEQVVVPPHRVLKLTVSPKLKARLGRS